MEEKKIILADEEQTLEFFVLEETKLNGRNYLLVTDAEDDEAEADCYVLKDMSAEGDEDALYEFVEDENELEAIWMMRRELGSRPTQEVAEMIIDNLAHTKNNENFIQIIKKIFRG